MVPSTRHYKKKHHKIDLFSLQFSSRFAFFILCSPLLSDDGEFVAHLFFIREFPDFENNILIPEILELPQVPLPVYQTIS